MLNDAKRPRLADSAATAAEERVLMKKSMSSPSLELKKELSVFCFVFLGVLSLQKLYLTRGFLVRVLKA